MTADVPRGFESFVGESIPQAAVGSPGKQGQLDLVFVTGNEGQTQLVRSYARVPFHVSGTLDHDPHPDASTVYIQSPTGGVAQGDRHDVNVTARPGTVAHVSTQSATKVQSMDRNYAAADVSLSVGASAHLDYVPDPTILHEDARYCQEVTLRIESDATAVLSDVVVPGRLARGERFDFDQYFSRLQVRGPDDLLFEDVTSLGERPESVGVLGEFDVYGTLYVIAPELDTGALSDRLHDAVSEDAARVGATALPNGAGVVVRALGRRADSVTQALYAAWDVARTTLLGAPAPTPRKY